MNRPRMYGLYKKARMRERKINWRAEARAEARQFLLDEFDNWLQGKVYCADCQKPMTLQIKVHKQTKRPIFRCIHSYKYPEECNGYRAMAYDRVLRLTYDKIVAECPYPEEAPELTKTLVRQRVDKVLVGKRQTDGRQEVQVLLNDPKRRKRRFALSLFGEL